jgi:drug/metabolite transporter superfamily protein YnfA
LHIDDERRILNWIMLTLSGACLAIFGFLLSFFWAATRYLEDGMPAMIMLSVIGFWQGYQSLRNKPIGTRFYTAIGVVLIAVSILISTLVAISVNDARFEIIRLLTFTK